MRAPALARQLSRFAHSSLRGLDREHFLQLTAATPPIILQHLQSGWKGWQREENAELKALADRQLIGMVPKVLPPSLPPPPRADLAGC